MRPTDRVAGVGVHGTIAQMSSKRRPEIDVWAIVAPKTALWGDGGALPTERDKCPALVGLPPLADEQLVHIADQCGARRTGGVCAPQARGILHRRPVFEGGSPMMKDDSIHPSVATYGDKCICTQRWLMR